MTQIETDLCVIGGGSGGLSVAAGAVQMGARVVLIEAGRMGGDCLNAGCVPSKALLAAAHRAADMAGGLGVAPAAAQVDFGAVKDHVAATIAAIAPHDSEGRFTGLGVTVLRGHAAFTGPREVAVGEILVRARRFVVATGSSPAIPPIPGLDAVPYLTNESIFDLRERPGHLVILGAGAVGVEMAQAHARLGCLVTVLEADRALGREDPELVAPLLARLRVEGVVIREGARVAAVTATTTGVALRLADGGVVEGTHLLVATGRKPNCEGLGLDLAGIRHGTAGIEVDRGLRTANRRVFAIGDVAGQGQFTHLAGYHAGLVVRSALLALPVRARNDHIPRAIYTDPELAQVGLTEAEARARYGAWLEVVRKTYDSNDRARAEGRAEGLMKVMIVAGRPVGAGVTGPLAGELIGYWSLAIANRLRMSALAGTVFPYPVRAELVKACAGAYFSPRLFANAGLKRVVRLIQRLLP
jgi:pyruvate/2-oxoglutarate dehydrogenase complex dihydrolipoamide dehydrogenase (E3) component